ncbi:hypothetical protein B9Z55_021858 [Caenorhabditis nigoni]|nr:hypothetical protein B9Z55_021858 [Caenorhabditis nigoni]
MSTTIRIEEVWGDEHLTSSREWPPKTPAYAQPLEATCIPTHWILMHMGVDDNGTRVNIYMDRGITRIIYTC